MSNNIASLLREYSRENAVIEPSESDMVASEDTVDLLVEEQSELELVEQSSDEINKEGEQIFEAVDAVVEADVSLENALEAVLSSRERGETINGVCLRMWTEGVVASFEARGIPAEIFIEHSDTASFESSVEDYSTEAEKKAEGFFARIWTMIKNAFQRVREWITRFFGWFRTSGSAVRKAAEKLKLQAEEKKKAGATAEGRHVNSAPFADLAIGAKVDALKSVQTLQAAVVTSMDSAIYMADIAKKAADEVAREKTLTQKLLSVFRTDVVKTLQSVQKDGAVSNLPGGRKLVVEVKDRGDKAPRVKLSVQQDGSKAKVDAKSKVISLDEIIAISNSLIKLVDTAEERVGKFDSAYGKLTLKPSVAGESDPAAARATAQLIVSTLSVAQRMSTSITKMVFPIAKRAYVYGAISVRQYYVKKK